MKERDSNLELYRIIVMIMIVAHHYVINSGLINVITEDISGSSSHFRQLFYFILGAWGKTGVNSFVLISGYFMCCSDITLYKFIKLVSQIIFYNIIIYIGFCIGGEINFSVRELICCLMPVRSIQSWNFADCYIIFWLLIPYLNISLRNMNKVQHLRLIIILLFTYCILELMPYCDVSMNYISWFVVLYFIASYVRLYPCAFFQLTRFWGIISLVFISLAILEIVIRNGCYRHVTDANSLFALLIGFSSFMYFKNIKIKRSRLVNGIASTTFGVLLIHNNSDCMRRWLWCDIVDTVGRYRLFETNMLNHVVYSITCIICIFLLCSLIDYIRINTIEKWILSYAK